MAQYLIFAPWEKFIYVTVKVATTVVDGQRSGQKFGVVNIPTITADI